MTAAKAGTNASYNARTRKLAAEADEPAEEGTVNLLTLKLPVLLAVLKEMTREELTEIVTLPDGRAYNYWGSSLMPAGERNVRGAAKRELARRKRHGAENVS